MTVPVAGNWKLTFGDEFNGTSINTGVWGTNWLGKPGAITKPVATQELGAYDPAMVSVSNGLLHLKTQVSPVTVNGINYDYRGGIVQTANSFSQTFGYFEARINLAGHNGKIDNWPAFWLAGKNWPTNGELDVMEGLAGDAAYHFHSPSGGPGSNVAGDYTGWHVFGALWEPGKVSFYYDNHLVGAITSGITNAPQYIILNLGIGKESLKYAPSEMQVDWVHAYSSDPGATTVASVQPTPTPVPVPAPMPAPAPAPVPAPVPVSVTPPSPTVTPVVIIASQSLNGSDGNDVLNGSARSDHITGYGGSDILSGSRGNDIVDGGTGNDVLRGNSGNDQIDGGAGNDTLAGAQGADWLVGGSGTDRMSGGIGADVFNFKTVADSSSFEAASDTITDFSHIGGDRISLSSIDANTLAVGDQSFRFIGTAAFTGHASELRVAYQGGNTVVSGDVDGNGTADFAIILERVTTMQAADFVL
jgi:Ca2+-binding RTX toxin-like protein